jgi:hypothetical protein
MDIDNFEAIEGSWAGGDAMMRAMVQVGGVVLVVALVAITVQTLRTGTLTSAVLCGVLAVAVVYMLVDYRRGGA